MDRGGRGAWDGVRDMERGQDPEMETNAGRPRGGDTAILGSGVWSDTLERLGQRAGPGHLQAEAREDVGMTVRQMC